MNFISKAKKISNLSEIREKQLDEYDNIYDNIKTHSNECPKEIIEFMINQHRLNRITSKKLYSDSLLNFFTNVDKNLGIIDNNINILKKMLKSKNFCKELNNFIYYQNKIINKKIDI